MSRVLRFLVPQRIYETLANVKHQKACLELVPVVSFRVNFATSCPPQGKCNTVFRAQIQRAVLLNASSFSAPRKFRTESVQDHTGHDAVWR